MSVLNKTTLIKNLGKDPETQRLTEIFFDQQAA